MGVICHATFFKPLVIKLQVCTSITASLLHFKSTVVGYRSKIIYTGRDCTNTVDCIHQTSVCTKVMRTWTVCDSSIDGQTLEFISVKFYRQLIVFLFVWGAFCRQPWKKKKKKTHEKLTKHADILAFLPQKQDWSRRYWLRGKPHTLCKHSVRGHTGIWVNWLISLADQWDFSCCFHLFQIFARETSR